MKFLAHRRRNDYIEQMRVQWTRSRAKHIATRSYRYQDAIDMEVHWTAEAANDPRAVVDDPDPCSHTDAMRIVGYSPTAGFVVTVIAAWVDGELWGVTAWKTSGSERRRYQEADHGDTT